jgi:hypothetical protein
MSESAKLGPEKKTLLTRPSSNCKLQIRPLNKEGAPHKQTCDCLKVKKIWSCAPRWVPDTMTEWPKDGRNITLTFSNDEWRRGKHSDLLCSSELHWRARSPSGLPSSNAVSRLREQPPARFGQSPASVGRGLPYRNGPYEGLETFMRLFPESTPEALNPFEFRHTLLLAYIHFKIILPPSFTSGRHEWKWRF